MLTFGTCRTIHRDYFLVMRIRSLVLIMLGLVALVVQPVSAEPPGTTIKHVNYQNRTITLELFRRDQGTKVVTVYKIDMGCTFTLDGVTVDLRKLHRGQHVMGMTEGQPGVLDSLTIQTQG